MKGDVDLLKTAEKNKQSRGHVIFSDGSQSKYNQYIQLRNTCIRIISYNIFLLFVSFVAESERNDMQRQILFGEEDKRDDVTSDLEEQEDKDEPRGVSGEFNHIMI